MVAEQINNKEIARIFDRYIDGKKDKYFFVISVGNFTASKLDPIHEKSFDYTGPDKFLELLDEALDGKPFYLGISIFEKAVTKLKEKSIFFKRITLIKGEQPQNDDGLNGISGLGMFGGIEGIMQSKISSQLLHDRNEDLKKRIENLERKNERLVKENKSLEDKINISKETEHTNEWELRTLVQDHENELRGLEIKNDRFEKIATVAGMIFANKAGIDASDLRGILGIEENKESPENTDKKEDDKDKNEDVVFEETNYEGKKKTAKEIADNISSFLFQLIEKNNEDDALRLINSINYVITYMQAKIENLKKMIDFISAEAEIKNNQQSAAEDVIDQVENYKHTG